MLHFRTRIYRALQKRGWVCRRCVSQSVLNRQYEIIDGSLRTNDYDDAWLLALGMRSRVVFDVGCNLGQSSLLLLYSDSVEEIFLIDPNPSALAISAENLILNGLSCRARFIRAFASDACDNEVDFYSVGAGAAGSRFRSHAKTASDLRAMTRVRTITLDSLSQRYHVVPDLVKVDVEGAECEVLSGARKLAGQHSSFLVEMHSNRELSMECNAANLLSWCKECGYSAWYLKSKQILSDPGVLKHRGRCHVLLLPQSRTFPEYLRALRQGAPLNDVNSARSGEWP